MRRSGAAVPRRAEGFAPEAAAATAAGTGPGPGPGPGTGFAPGAGPGSGFAPGSGADPGVGLRTEFPFRLPRGYVDERGVVHRDGVMRLATARDELVPLRDDRVRENPAYLSVVLISRVVTRIGGVDDIHPGIVEDLFASDLAFLQDFYRRVNAEGHTRAAVTCPSCQEEFAVDLAGGRLGES
ncbi:hypothetical protein AB0C52_15340 [Streptomyces sp. NPDC048717]|uniref:hypothetical protein n=1 Tax=Streptomyces sp. NPDC048717 TaxID=3154928 RepID=UPI00343D3378